MKILSWYGPEPLGDPRAKARISWVSNWVTMTSKLHCSILRTAGSQSTMDPFTNSPRTVNVSRIVKWIVDQRPQCILYIKTKANFLFNRVCVMQAGECAEQVHRMIQIRVDTKKVIIRWFRWWMRHASALNKDRTCSDLGHIIGEALGLCLFGKLHVLFLSVGPM